MWCRLVLVKESPLKRLLAATRVDRFFFYILRGYLRKLAFVGIVIRVTSRLGL